MDIPYAPKFIYQNINSVLDGLKEQSNLLHKSIQNIDVKCTQYKFISENEIDNLINTIRNYTLIKENCLEQSEQILCLDNINSIDLLSSKVEEHQNKSIAIMNDVLYYAYEFLKIKSDNIITDGLLQDHHEKLHSIIDAMLNQFVDINEISKQLEPYKIALLYVTHRLNDLTQYAELMSNTFGAILFYNIISGNNIQYNTDVQSIQEDTNQESILETLQDIETPTQEDTNQEPTLEITQDIETPTQEDTNQELTLEITQDIETPTQEDTNQEPTLETPQDIETPTQEDINQEPTLETLQDIETPIQEDINQEPTLETSTDTIQIEVSKTLEDINIVDINTDDTLETSLESLPQIDYFENLSTSIFEKYTDTPNIFYDTVSFNEEIAVNTICDYIISKEFACASMMLKEYSKLSVDMENLYFEYSLAIGEPSIKHYYANVFITDTIEPLHQWLQLSTLLRTIFTCNNKENECYNFVSYMTSLTQNIQDTVTVHICNFTSLIKILEEINYNADFLIGIKLFDEKNNITQSIKREALDILPYCEQSMHNWNHKVMSDITKNLFSPSGGYVYNLIHEISLGNFKSISQIKAYCNQFSDENNKILERTQLNDKVSSYLRELWSNSSKRFNSDNDINIGYRNKFSNRFIHILNFLFSCIDKINAFDVNYINENNVSTYKILKNNLIEICESNSKQLLEKSNSSDISKLEKVGMICLSKTFKDIISYVNYENYNHNYFYCELLKTGYFILDDMYIPYLNESIHNVNGLEISSRIQKHIKDVEYINSWKDAIKNNLKKLNVGNIHLIVSYLKDTNQYDDDLQQYVDESSQIEYSIEDRSNQFYNELKNMCVMECIYNKSIFDRLLSMESIVKDIVIQVCNYGFYEMFLDLLKNYTIKVCESSYLTRNNIIDVVGTSLGYNSDYYINISRYIDCNYYLMADNLLSMYFNGMEYPSNIDNSNIEQYNDIFSQFNEFCNEYADNLSSPNGYIFMNEFYDSYIKPIVIERFSGSYDCVKSDELIGSWSKGQNTTNVVYDILTNIGFSIEKSIPVDDRTFKMILSHYEKNNTQPYVIPENTIFVNKIYNIAQADRNINTLNITQDTLIILDYALNLDERKYILDILEKISNGNRIILADRCVIMFLATIPSNIRKLAFKVCSICNHYSNISYISDFRGDYVQSYIKNNGVNLLLGRENFGKTSMIKNITDILNVDDDNIVIYIDALNNTLDTPSLIDAQCKTLELKINPFTDWATFETSMVRYLNKHPKKKIYTLIDSADTFLNECINNSKTSVMSVFKNLSKKFKSRFNFTIVADMYGSYLDYASKCNLSYDILKPLSYEETAKMFENYLNSARISINDIDTMTLLVSLTFGCPKIVKLVSKQIISEIINIKDTSQQQYIYDLTLENAIEILSNEKFISSARTIFLSAVIGNQEGSSYIIPVIYGMVYFFDEHSNSYSCTINDIKGVLNIFDIEESSQLNIQNAINELCLLGVVCKLNDTDYFFSHNAYKHYFGNKEFTFDMLDCCTKIFKKDGITP